MQKGKSDLHHGYILNHCGMKRVPKGHDHSTKTQIVELKDAEVLKNHEEWEWRECTVVITQSNWELLM